MTVLDFITDIFLQIGVINQGDTPNPSEQAQVFSAINRRTDLWSAASTFIYAVQEATLPLAATKGAYIVGLGGGADLTIARPFIRHARVQLPNSSVQLPIEIVGQADWNAIEEPTLSGQRPQKLFPDYQWPNMNLKCWPIPSLGGSSIIMEIWQTLAPFVSVTDTFNLPYGYWLALEFQVCLDIWPSYSSQVNPANYQAIAQGAGMAEQIIQSLNAQLLTGRAAGPIPEMPPMPVQQVPQVQPMPGNPPQ